jgi:adenylylsulfate kinase-like enzyme
MIIWLIGMSGSGKTTLATRLYEQLKPTTPALVRLDGDVVRDVFGNDVEHSIEGRYRNAERISQMCKMLDAQGIHVIAAVLSIFPEWQSWNREHFSRYFEVYLDIPLDVLRSRDTKGLYAAADLGELKNMVGYDIPFPPPASPDMVIGHEDQARGIDVCADTILTHLGPLNG